MPRNSILESTSFSTLDAAGQDAVRRLFVHNYLTEDVAEWDTVAVFRQRKSLAESLEYYSGRLAKINPASFKFLEEHQRTALLQELLFTFYLMSAQFHLDEIEHRRQGQKDLSDKIKYCAQLIHDLNLSSSEERIPATMLAAAVSDSEKHLKYLGLTIVAPFIADKMVEFSNAKTDVVKGWMREVNGRRLYWVWGGGLLSSVISMLPDDFAYKQQGQQAVSSPSSITGYMSWMLYYTRFGINLSLLLKHTIAGPWMSVEERKIPAWERFKTQWDARKFSLLNDSIWATANMVCFFWLTGSGLLGYLGNGLTAGLLLMDVSLTIWGFCEESTKHNKQMVRYEDDLALLEGKISSELDQEELKVLQTQRTALIKAKNQCASDWAYKKYGLINDLVYATGLLAAFSVLCCFYIPPAALLPATSMILGIVGGALCFVFTMAYAATTGALEIAKARNTGQQAKEECAQLLEQYKSCNNGLQKKQLYLDMKQLMSDSEYQERVVHFQKISLVRAILVDALVPPLIFVSFVFMPLGLGVVVLAAGLALAVLSHVLLNRLKPAENQLPKFNDEDYAEFLADPSLEKLKEDKASGQARFGLFGASSPSPSSVNDTSLNDAQGVGLSPASGSH